MGVTTPEMITKLHHKCPTWAMLLFFWPLIYLVALVAKIPFLALVTGRLPVYVLSGKLFTEPFNIVHAGTALDQPTIGKWLLWFAVLAAISMPVILLARWLSDCSTKARYWTYAVPVLVIGILLVSVLILPLCWLIQYVYWMGITPKRLYGLSFGFAALILLPVFLSWTLRKDGGATSQRDQSSREMELNGDATP